MKSRFRLLPIVIFCAALTVTLKLGNIWLGVGGFVTPSSAQETAKADKTAAKKYDTETSGDTSAKSKSNVPDGSEKYAAASKSEKSDDNNEIAKPEDSSGSWFDPATITDAELQVLQNLSERRKQIDARERSLDMRAGLLQATEQRIDKKIGELKKIQDVIEGLLQRHKKQRDKQMKSVVKIYENMKPKDAARIFEQLDMAILLDVVERMREAKTAPIMANMSPGKAKAVTAAMARRRALPKPKKPKVR